MTKIFFNLILLLGMALHTPASAQGGASGDALYKALGEKPGIAKIVDEFVTRMVADPRISPMFKNTKLPNLKEQIGDQFCYLSGGPCKYRGDSMKAAHKDMGVNKANFNQVVEHLQLAMDSNSVPFRDQNRLLALLAPMNRDIITK